MAELEIEEDSCSDLELNDNKTRKANRDNHCGPREPVKSEPVQSKPSEPAHVKRMVK